MSGLCRIVEKGNAGERFSGTDFYFPFYLLIFSSVWRALKIIKQKTPPFPPRDLSKKLYT